MGSAIGLQRQFRRPDGSIVDAESENQSVILFCGVSSSQVPGGRVNLRQNRASACDQATSPTWNKALKSQERSSSPWSAISSMSRIGPAQRAHTNRSESTPRGGGSHGPLYSSRPWLLCLQHGPPTGEGAHASQRAPPQDGSQRPGGRCIPSGHRGHRDPQLPLGHTREQEAV